MGGETTRILLVEDNPGDVDLLRLALSEVPSERFEIEDVDRLKTALTVLSASGTAVDVVLLDLGLPDSSGLDTLIEVRQSAPDLPIVVLTGRDDQALALAALKNGAQDYLVKEVGYGDSLRRSLRYAIERRQAETARLHLVEERAARAAAEVAQERSAFLADASVLLAGSFDYERTLDDLTRLAVARVADCCIIELLRNEQSPVEHLSVAHRNPARVVACREVWRGLSRETPRTRGPVLVNDPGSSRLLGNLGATSAVIAPMAIREDLIGRLLLVFTGQGHEYGQLDLAMAEDLGRRAALAVDNARLYRSAQAALRIRDEFLAVAAHELRTPLTNLTLHLSYLQRTLPVAAMEGGNGKISSTLDRINKAASRLCDLVDSLLDVSRISAGRFRPGLNPEELDVRELVQQVVDQFSEAAAAAGCGVTLHAESEIKGELDRSRVEQIVANLLSNAIKFGSGHPIELNLSADAATVTLSVRDHGIGIPKEDQPRIFDRFERAVSRAHYGGLGLGLYITAQIIEALGGSIAVSSEVGAGSLFTAQLPYQSLASKEAARTPL